MIEAALVTVLPAGFLIVLFGGGAFFRKRKIEQDGQAPINRTLFYLSTYSILVLWGAMVVQSWGIRISMVDVPRALQLFALCLWGLGFLLLYLGRFSLGDSFRLGTPKENTAIRKDGLFRLSRTPMYVGVYANDRCIIALYPQPVRHPSGSIRHCRPPCDRSCRGGSPADCIWSEIYGVPQPRETVRLAACLRITRKAPGLIERTVNQELSAQKKSTTRYGKPKAFMPGNDKPGIQPGQK